MRVLSESCCFCNGGGRSERIKASIFSIRSSNMGRVTVPAASSSSDMSGAGFLIHRNLLLTTHSNLPSVSAVESAVIRLHNGLSATLLPHRIFITSSVLDLTIVGLDYGDGVENSQGQQPHFSKTCSKLNLDLGSMVYVLGFTGNGDLTVGEGKVVVATDDLIKLSIDGAALSPGSVGFDAHGNLAFMVCDPMKLATSPNMKSSSTSCSSNSSWKNDLQMQFGIPMPIICNWLNQHLDWRLGELSKQKLPLMKLVSSNHRTEHSCTSFAMRQVFKLTEPDIDQIPSSSQTVTKPWEPPQLSCSPTAQVTNEGKKVLREPHAGSHVQGIQTPDIFGSPKVTAVPLCKRESTLVHLLDISFPPWISNAVVTAHTADAPLPSSGDNRAMESSSQGPAEEQQTKDHVAAKLQSNAKVGPNADVESTGSVNECQSEVHSSSSVIAASEVRDGQTSEVETMYSAETAESRNYPSPRTLTQWTVGKQRIVTRPKNPYSAGATSHRSNDYFSPTVSSVMKKRNNLDIPSRYRQTASHSSPRWIL